MHFLGQLDCKDCPPGYYCPAGGSEPVACPKGTYNPIPLRGSLGECRSCISGTACPRPGLTWPPVKCDAGYYCPAGSSLPNETIHACPAGTYTDYHNLTHARECTDCPGRQSCEAGTGGIQKPPQECAKGKYVINPCFLSFQIKLLLTKNCNFLLVYNIWQEPRGRRVLYKVLQVFGEAVP